MKATVIVYRFDPAQDKEAHYQEYTVDSEPTDKILDCLNKIRWEQDPTLAYRASCVHGICGSDAMVINGRVELACQKLIRDFKTGNNFVIEPLPLFKVIKDLVVDLEIWEQFWRTSPVGETLHALFSSISLPRPLQEKGKAKKLFWLMGT